RLKLKHHAAEAGGVPGDSSRRPLTPLQMSGLWRSLKQHSMRRRNVMDTATNQSGGAIKPREANLQTNDSRFATIAIQIRGIVRRTLYPTFTLCLLMLIASVSRAETYQIL